MSLSDTFFRDRKSVGMPVRQGPLLLATIAFLTLAMLGPLMIINDSVGVPESGNTIRQVLYVVIFGLIIYALRPFTDLTRLLVIPLPLLTALGWCWLSALWAIDPGTSVRKVILTSMVIWSIFLITRQLTIDTTMNLLRAVLAVTLVANWIAVLAFPEFAIHQANGVEDKKLIGDWSGVMVHKNIAGAVCAVTILVFAFDAKKVYWLIRLGAIAAAAVFLYYSQSKTSGAMVLGALAVGALYERYKSPYRGLVIGLMFILFVALTIALYIYKDPLQGNFTSPKAFTGRIQIWQAMLNYAADHWYSGAGFGSFWAIGPASPIYSLAKGWVLKVSQGHSGYLDLLITVGIVGLVLIVFAVIIWPSIRLLTLPVGMTPYGALPLSILFFCSGQNATESSIFDRDTLVNVFMLFAIALIERIRQQQQQGANRTAPIFATGDEGGRGLDPAQKYGPGPRQQWN